MKMRPIDAELYRLHRPLVISVENIDDSLKGFDVLICHVQVHHKKPYPELTNARVKSHEKRNPMKKKLNPNAPCFYAYKRFTPSNNNSYQAQAVKR
jgi:hypothetical protein